MAPLRRNAAIHVSHNQWCIRCGGASPSTTRLGTNLGLANPVLNGAHERHLPYPLAALEHNLDPMELSSFSRSPR
jgi:hypothetical protein